VPPDKELSDMDLRAVKVILEEIDDHLMGGLLSVDIISKASGMSLAGINSAPKACALFNRLSEQLHSALTKSEDSLARGINKFIIEGDNGLYIFVIELDERHRWAMLVDGARAQLGHGLRDHPRDPAAAGRSRASTRIGHDGLHQQGLHPLRRPG
jgi:hypothetical protein